MKTNKKLFGNDSFSALATAEMLPFANGRFDAVVSQDLFEHLESENSADEAFDEMVRVCKGHKMLHKITVIEDKEWIDADESHRIKWYASQWRNWFEERGWHVSAQTTKKFPIWNRRKIGLMKMHGYFLLERF